MKSIQITLGGVAYTVQELPVRKNAAWRKQLAEPFGELARVLQQAPQREINNLEDMVHLVRDLSDLLIGSVDVIIDLLFAYSSDLSAARTSIEENAYESEIMEAFAGVLGLAFPFSALGGKALQTIRDLSANKPT